MIELDRKQCQQVLGVARTTLYRYEDMPDYPAPSTHVSQKNIKWPREGILRFKERLNQHSRKKRAG